MTQSWRIVLILAGLAIGTAQAAPPESVRPLRNVYEIRKLTYEESRLAPPVAMRVTVTSHSESGFDAQDNTGGLFFRVSEEKLPSTGETVEIHGNVTGGFLGPYVTVDWMKRHGGGGMPRPIYFRPDFIQTGLADNRWTEIEGLMVDVEFGENRKTGSGILVTGETELSIRFQNESKDFDVNRLKKMVGSLVKLKGTGAPLFNDQRQRIGSDLICSRHHFVEVVTQTKDTPVVGLGEIGRWDSDRTTLGLVRAEGIVTLVEDARSFVLQSGTHGARIRTLRPHSVAPGDSLAVVGLPDTEGYFVGLRYASAEVVEERPPEIEAVPDQAAATRENAFQIIDMTGRFVERQGRLLSLQQGEQLIPVRLASSIALEDLPVQGSELAVSGVKLVDADERGSLRSVTIATRSPEDIVVLAVPSWWTPQRYLIAISILVAGVILFLFWTLALKRRVQTQTALIESQLVSNAALEERNRIARDLHDTLSQGFSGVGYQLASVKNHLETDPERALQKLDTARQMVEHSLAEARDSLCGLRIPVAADSLQFPATTISIARERCEEADLNLIVHHTLDLEQQGLEAETAYTCHRILLEAVMNAIRHSGGDSVGFATGRTERELVFCVSDNGRGFDPAVKPAGHFGIQGMQERARQIEAALEVDSSGEGTRLSLSVPI